MLERIWSAYAAETTGERTAKAAVAELDLD
jgi:hypothetical protein